VTSNWFLRGCRAATPRRVQAALAGRVAAEKPGDPVLPWVRRTSRAIYETLKASLDRDRAREEAAQADYDRLVDEARRQAAIWREDGRDDLAERLSILLKTEM